MKCLHQLCTAVNVIHIHHLDGIERLYGLVYQRDIGICAEFFHFTNEDMAPSDNSTIPPALADHEDVTSDDADLIPEIQEPQPGGVHTSLQNNLPHSFLRIITNVG